MADDTKRAAPAPPDTGAEGTFVVLLGNSSVIEVHDAENVSVDPQNPDDGLKALDARTPKGAKASLRPDGRVRVDRPDLGNRITRVSVPRLTIGPDGQARPMRPNEVVRTVLDPANGVWAFHSDADGPEWVECDENPAVAQAIANEFTGSGHMCHVGRPKGWRADDEEQDRPPMGGGSRDLDDLWNWQDPVSGPWDAWERYRTAMLMTNVGRDGNMRLGYDTNRSSLTGPWNYMGLTANSGSPAAGDTSLTGEITTAGGGLIRAQATFAHTGGTSTLTLTKTFTANGSDSLPVTIAKIGLFDASTSGNMGHAVLLASTATLSASGDNVTVTYTGTWTPS